MSLYSFAGQVVLGTPVRGVIIDAAQILEDESRFGRGFTYRTQAQTQEWVADLRYWLTLAEQYAVNNYWPMNDKSCGHYRSEKDDRSGCPFREICGKDPSVRETFLKTQFTKLEERMMEPSKTKVKVGTVTNNPCLENIPYGCWLEHSIFLSHIHKEDTWWIIHPNPSVTNSSLASSNSFSHH